MFIEIFKTILGPSLVGFWAIIQSLIIAVSLFFVYRQIKLHRFSNMINSIDFLDKKWNTEIILESRVSVCRKFKERKRSLDEVDQHLIGFFEELGLYLKKGVFDIEIIWEIYCDYIEKYWPITEPLIKDFRAKRQDNTYYWNFEYLYKEIVRHSKKNDCPIPAKTEKQILDQAEYELKHLDKKGIN